MLFKVTKALDGRVLSPFWAAWLPNFAVLGASSSAGRSEYGLSGARS